MKILITGGAGYVGTTLVPMLLEKGYEVIVYDNLMYTGTFVIPFFDNYNFKFINGDIREKDKISRIVKKVDAIIHLAALVGYPACHRNPQLAKTVHVDGTNFILNAKRKDQPLLYASTGSVYGKIDGICTESSAVNPLTLYGITKYKAEQNVLQHENTTALRFATAYGIAPRLRLDLLINNFVYQAVKNKQLVVYQKDARRTFIDVKDIARTYLFALDHMDEMNQEVYNVGDEKLNFTKQEVCELIKEHYDYYIHYANINEDPDKRDYEVSYQKIKKLGYKTKEDIHDGIKKLIKAVEVFDFQNPFTNNAIF